MKTTQVPQDPGKLDGEKELCYAQNEAGRYVAVQSEGWIAKNTTLDQAWDFVNQNTDQALQQVQTGKRSWLYYWMSLNMMDPGLLSDYSGFSKRKIKKHLRPEVFNNLDISILEKYAWVFRVTVTELQQGPEL